MRHKTKILYLDGVRCRIDRDIAPVILALDALGVGTYSCCQGSCMGRCGRKHKRGRKLTYTNKDGTTGTYWERIYPKHCLETVTIAFNTTTEATKFLNLVFRHADAEPIRDQIRGLGSKRSRRWIWCSSIDGDRRCDLGENYISRRGSWVPMPRRPFRLTIGMLCLFPRAHLPLVTQRVQQALTRRQRRTSASADAPADAERATETAT